MEATKLFDDLTWDEVVIEHGRIKSIQAPVLCPIYLSSVMANMTSTTLGRIWRPSPTSILLWLWICLKKHTLIAQEDHPQEYPQQAVHWQQNVKATRVK